jgi:hypothetical protein
VATASCRFGRCRACPGYRAKTSTGSFNTPGGFVDVILHFNNDFTLSANGNSVTERDRFNEFDVNFAGGGFPTQVITSGHFVHIRLPVAGSSLRRGASS